MLFPELFPQIPPAITEPVYQKPIVTKTSLILRCLCSLLIIVLLMTLVIVTVFMTNPNVNSTPYAPDMEWVPLEVSNDLNAIEPFNQPRKLYVPQGFGIEAYAQVPSARFLLRLPDDDILVSQPEKGIISILKPPPTLGVSAIRRTFAANLHLPNDMVLHTDDNGDMFIYVAEATRISRYPYKKGQMELGVGQVLIEHLPYHKGYMHPYKSIAIGNETLYVSISSSSDMSPQDLMSDPKQGAIYGYQISNGGKKRLISQGLRRAEGLAIEPGTENLWAVVNQRYDIKYPYLNDSYNYGEYVEEYAQLNPPEEFVKIDEGEHFGWPFCNPVPSSSSIVEKLEYIADVENNPNEMFVNCSIFRKVNVGLAPHSVPLGLTFWTGDKVDIFFRRAAIVALHDNWYEGHKVIYLPWRRGEPIAINVLIDGWVTDPVRKVRWGQPTDVAVLEDGNLLISDGLHGAIYRLYKKTY